jgi:hypothetical protein
MVPGNNLNYIRKGLTLLRDFYNSESINYEEFKRLVDELYHDSDNAYFFWYWCDKEGYTEHGSGLPGWLTEEGEQLLVQLEECRQEGYKWSVPIEIDMSALTN